VNGPGRAVNQSGGGGVLGTGATTFTVQNSGFLIGLATIPVVYQGAVLWLIHRGSAEVMRILFYDTTGPMTSCIGMSRLNLEAQGGSGNTGKIAAVGAAGDVALVTAAFVTGGSTTDASPYTVGVTSYATLANAAAAFPTTAAALIPA
jgi:hypothetical protein